MNRAHLARLICLDYISYVINRRPLFIDKTRFIKIILIINIRIVVVINRLS